MMNKTVYVPSYFQPIYKEVTIKVPTGNTKRFLGLIDIEEKIRKREVIQDGWSDCQIDGERLNEDVGRAINKLNREGYEVISITPATSGSWAYKYKQNSIRNGNGDGSYGYGYGYSYTEGVMILEKKIEKEDV
ncbi:hypothetical protein WFN89_20310 [Yersinia enterocolitica]|nr:hypothetical protein [Yersinia enterocolitica]